MEKQRSYSHGLLHSIAPSNFSALHLHEADGKDEFDWEAYEAQYKGASLVEAILSFVKTTAISWGLIKVH